VLEISEVINIGRDFRIETLEKEGSYSSQTININWSIKENGKKLILTVRLSIPVRNISVSQYKAFAQGVDIFKKLVAKRFVIRFKK